MTRKLQLLFWVSFGLLVAWDLNRSAPIDRFAEPPLIAAGSGAIAVGGHCSAAPR